VVRDPAALDRIRRLAIPPAWSDVWICARPEGHLQATGRDARGRKQHRYHAAFRARRSGDKYARMERFAAALPRIRRRVTADLRRPGLPREKVLAATVRLLERTLVRVGNDAYARENGSFGLSTLRKRHVRIDGAGIRFRFRGKSGQIREVGIRDRALARIVRGCQDLPGQELFEYVDADGEVHDVGSDDVNTYIREAAGSDEFSAKDFRTWVATVLAVRFLAAGSAGAARHEAAVPEARLRREVRTAIEATAERLGNTAVVARQAYVHPAVVAAYLDDDARPAIAAARRVGPQDGPLTRAEERLVLRLLRGRPKARP